MTAIPRPIGNIIVNYLTPLPTLPFESELLKTMKFVSNDLKECIYYEEYYLDKTEDNEKQYVQCALILTDDALLGSPYIGHINHRRFK